MNQRPVILAITEEAACGEALGRIVQGLQGGRFVYRRMTYAQCSAMLSTELIEDVDLFLLDLFRSFPGGMRAEGVAMADRMSRQGKLSLVLSPLMLSKEIESPVYWDLAHRSELGVHISDLLDHPYSPSEVVRPLRTFFGPLLEIPPQHSH